ncbi:MAG TPA: hypothetical protein VGO53_05975 [Steroidobacteraceae bacterium]|nr:hypothetical protein [Steroidobacteraceae bacterium]
MTRLALTMGAALVGWLTFCPFARADFDSARAAYARHDFNTAAKEFRAVAELGHPSAQFNLTWYGDLLAY